VKKAQTMTNSTDKLKSISKVQLDSTPSAAIKNGSDALLIDDDSMEKIMIEASIHQPNINFVNKVKTTLALSLIRNGLLRLLQAPTQQLQGLYAHSYFCLLFHTEQRLELLETQEPLGWHTFDSLAQLQSLSHQLKAALPELALDLKSEGGLALVWKEAVLSLLVSPLPGSLFDNLASVVFVEREINVHQMFLAKPPSRLPVIGKSLSFLRNLPRFLCSLSLIRRSLKKSHPTKANKQHNK